MKNIIKYAFVAMLSLGVSGAILTTTTTEAAAWGWSWWP